jgi:hypothetical protein
VSKISAKVLLDPGEWWTRGECGLTRRTGGESNRSKGSTPNFLPEIYEYKASTWLVLRHWFTRLEPYHFQQTSIEFWDFPTFPWVWNHPISPWPVAQLPVPFAAVYATSKVGRDSEETDCCFVRWQWYLALLVWQHKSLLQGTHNHLSCLGSFQRSTFIYFPHTLALQNSSKMTSWNGIGMLNLDVHVGTYPAGHVRISSQNWLS